MKNHPLLLLTIAFTLPLAAMAEPAGPPPVAPAVSPAVPAAVVPAEKPKLAEKPQPAERRPAPAAVARAVEPRPEKPAEPQPSPPAAATVANSEAAKPEAGSSSIGCWAVSFAMLIVGFVAGFLGRHYVSRRKLGGMTVRIGTWRGIP
jgi:hypothetical protein